MLLPPTIGVKASCFPVVLPLGRCPLPLRSQLGTYFQWCDMSFVSGEISMKLRTNIYRVSKHCREVVQVRGRRSRSVYKCVEACISTVWCWGSVAHLLQTFATVLYTPLFRQSWTPPGAIVAFLCDSGAGYISHDLLTYLFSLGNINRMDDQIPELALSRLMLCRFKHSSGLNPTN